MEIFKLASKITAISYSSLANSINEINVFHTCLLNYVLFPLNLQYPLRILNSNSFVNKTLFTYRMAIGVSNI